MKRKASSKRIRGVGPKKMQTISIRVTDADKAKFEGEAARRGQTTSDFAVSSMRAATGMDKILERGFGAPENRALGVLIGMLARALEFSTGMSWRRDDWTHREFLAGVLMLLQHLRPGGHPQMPARLLAMEKQRLDFEQQLPEAIRCRLPASNYDQPGQLGMSATLGLIDQLRLHREDPANIPTGVQLSDSFYLFPVLRRDLELEDTER